MRTKLYPYLMATIAVAFFPAGASAGTALGLPSQEGSTKTAEPTRSACGRPDVAARLTQAAPIEVSRFADITGGYYGSASVAVTLAPDGRLLRAAILHGSGNIRFDESALQAIRQSTFTPEQRNCGNVGGTYRVEADPTADAG